MAGLKSSKEGAWRLPVDPDVPAGDAPAVIKTDEAVGIDADMIEAGIRTDLEIGPARRRFICFEFDQRRGQMMTYKRQRRVAWATAQGTENFGWAFRAGPRKFKHAVRRKTRGKTVKFAAIAVDGVARDEIGNGHAFGKVSIGHAVSLVEYLTPGRWHEARFRRKGLSARGNSK